MVVSSDLPELMQLCDRIVVLSTGRLTGELNRDQFDEQKLLALAYHEYLKVEEEYAEPA
jgi:ribose transport system ATP-binding protein